MARKYIGIGEGPVLKVPLFRNSDRLAGTFHWSEALSTAWLVPYSGPQKIPLAENRFLQVGKGAENTNKTSRQCFKVTKGAFRLGVRDSKVEFPNIP